MDISNLRREYCLTGLKRDELKNNPFEQFKLWFSQAQKAELEEPNAMSLSTVSKLGMPSSRTVLLKLFDESGFVFFTNFKSQKAIEINDNPHVCLLFPWLQLERQIRITGTAKKISKTESFNYFTSRPKGSQLGAWSSPQSRIIESRDFLKMQLNKMKDKFSQGKIPLPEAWGGYKVNPTRFEFWQGRSNRLHDRFVYAKQSEKWTIQRLAP